MPSEKSLHIFMNGLSPKSLYRSHLGSHLYGTEYEILADFGPIGNTEKNWADYEQLLRAFFFKVFMSKKNL